MVSAGELADPLVEDGVEALADFLESLLLLIIWALPWLVLIAAVVAVIAGIRRVRRRR